MAYVNFVSQEGLSNKCLERLDNLMTILCGCSPAFTSKDVIRFMNEVEHSIISKIEYYCNRCGYQKKHKRQNCLKCDISARNLLETVTYVKCDVTWQLKDLLRAHGHEIIQAHDIIISQRTSHFTPNDIRRSEGYRRLVESRERNEKNEINLICTYSSDGAAFKRISRREATPVFINCEGFDVETKKNGRSLCMISITFSDGGIKKSLIHETIDK
ncbi:hypothetical protein B9Z55_015122 [Caenorhabditis nigoni]|uniref:Uncharacterized protein n=1 Tax=Caenorhabditis nigoni TaxID=1611254 RepID=A0A2G5U8U6_9PELO|nr:hypothetical protein B9Z55_015122 [Caenorhabditis nigoni]